MCGLTGFSHFAGRPPDAQDILGAMCASLAHRGPDGQGLFSDQRVSLGHRRLSIIDLEGGRQPMTNEDGSLVVVFNGEIYNFPELRQELLALGHVLATNSDTEVLVHGYESWGLGLLARLNGMFALALYDQRRDEIILARDPLGKKPLYYAQAGQDILFASELKALLMHPWLAARRDLDHESLALYLSLEYVPTPRTILEGVRRLRPGHFLVAGPGRVREQAYWDLAKAAAAVDVPQNEEEATERFWELFQASVRRRLISDVPLGVFLSGGLDSSAVALAARAAHGGQVATFSIGFAEPDFDESAHAQAAAQAIGTRHASQQFSLESMLEVLPAVLAGLDEPMADSSILPTYLLCRFAREHVTVALSGDGADEFLGGYPTFAAHQLARRLGRPLGRILRGLAPLANLLPVSHGNLSLEFRLKWFLRGLGLPAGQRLLTWLGAFNQGELAGLLTPEVWRPLAAAGDGRAALAGAPADFGDLGHLSRLYARTYLENDILVKVDRAAMLNSLEVRSPFLDPGLVAYLAALPDRFRRQPRVGGKVLLKRALASRLPAGLVNRPKQGFGVPVSSWLAGPLSEMVDDLLSPSRLAQEGLFQPRAVRRLLDDHRQKRRDNRKFLWTLLMFQGWRRHYLDRPLAGAARPA